MGEFVELIEEIRKDRNQFYRLINKFEPLIKKYTRKLYKDEEDDVRAEYLLALWEAVQRMEYNRCDGEIVEYLNNAVQMKFQELYRKSRKQHDRESNETVEEKPQTQTYEEKEYSKILLRQDLKKFASHYTGVKKQIFSFIVEEGMSDAEIAEKIQKSRQYVHRIRRYLYGELKKYIEF